MGSKLYVGGLPYSATEQQLSDLFGAHGTVASVRIITDKFTGQSRGFGFVLLNPLRNLPMPERGDRTGSRRPQTAPRTTPGASGRQAHARYRR